MSDTEKPGQDAISTGTNSRPREETIAQTAAGLPDDSANPVEITKEEEEAIQKKIRSL